MKITKTALQLGASALMLLVFTVIIVVVFGQLRFDATQGYHAEFRNASGIRVGQMVRVSGVEVGKVVDVHLAGDGHTISVGFQVSDSLVLDESVHAKIRYADLIGNRYLELVRTDDRAAVRELAPGGSIPVDRTEPALDLDALIGGFKPLFKSLDADKVNTIAQSLITVFQGQGGTIDDILGQTAELTNTLAQRDQAIGEVITNLNVVLTTAVKHQREFDKTVVDLKTLIAGLNDRGDDIAAGVADIGSTARTLADLLGVTRPRIKETLGHFETIQQPLLEQRAGIDDLLTKLPNAISLLARSGGVYGDFFNFYLCDVSLKVNGLQPGGPVRTVKIASQPSGRCALQ